MKNLFFVFILGILISFNTYAATTATTVTINGKFCGYTIEELKIKQPNIEDILIQGTNVTSLKKAIGDGFFSDERNIGTLSDPKKMCLLLINLIKLPGTLERSDSLDVAEAIIDQYGNYTSKDRNDCITGLGSNILLKDPSKIIYSFHYHTARIVTRGLTEHYHTNDRPSYDSNLSAVCSERGARGIQRNGVCSDERQRAEQEQLARGLLASSVSELNKQVTIQLRRGERERLERELAAEKAAREAAEKAAAEALERERAAAEAEAIRVATPSLTVSIWFAKWGQCEQHTKLEDKIKCLQDMLEGKDDNQLKDFMILRDKVDEEKDEGTVKKADVERMKAHMLTLLGKPCFGVEKTLSEELRPLFMVDNFNVDGAIEFLKQYVKSIEKWGEEKAIQRACVVFSVIKRTTFKDDSERTTFLGRLIPETPNYPFDVNFDRLAKYNSDFSTNTTDRPSLRKDMLGRLDTAIADGDDNITLDVLDYLLPYKANISDKANYHFVYAYDFGDNSKPFTRDLIKENWMLNDEEQGKKEVAPEAKKTGLHFDPSSGLYTPNYSDFLGGVEAKERALLPDGGFMQHLFSLRGDKDNSFLHDVFNNGFDTKKADLLLASIQEGGKKGLVFRKSKEDVTERILSVVINYFNSNGLDGKLIVGSYFESNADLEKFKAKLIEKGIPATDPDFIKITNPESEEYKVLVFAKNLLGISLQYRTDPRKEVDILGAPVESSATKPAPATPSAAPAAKRPGTRVERKPEVMDAKKWAF